MGNKNYKDIGYESYEDINNERGADDPGDYSFEETIKVSGDSIDGYELFARELKELASNYKFKVDI